MKKSNNLRTGRHCVFDLHAHLVFVTKYRKNVFTNESLTDLKTILRRVCYDFGTDLVEFNGETDHVHLLVNYPSKVSISKLVNSLKGVSSRLLQKSHPSLKAKYWKGSLWSPSYFAGSCGGATISLVRKYIENQKVPD